MKPKIKLGDRVECQVTGLIGIASSRITYLNGCVQYGIEPPYQPGTDLKSHYVDAQQLEVIEGGLNDAEEDQTIPRVRTGGPQGHRTPSGMSHTSTVRGPSETISHSAPRADKYNEVH